MNNTQALLKNTSHRPIPLPQRSWKYYQEWTENIFLHYKVSADVIQELLPTGLAVDTFNGGGWVSVVGFTVKGMRTKHLPPLPYVSTFHEINLRTYVVKNNVPGIYFLSIETNKLFTVIMANAFIGLKYKPAKVKRRRNYYRLSKSPDNNQLTAKYLTLGEIKEKVPLEKWLTERYCAYEVIKDTLYRFNIHHLEWPLKNMKIKQLRILYKYNNLLLHDFKPDLMHYSPLQKVLLWGRETC